MRVHFLLFAIGVGIVAVSTGGFVSVARGQNAAGSEKPSLGDALKAGRSAVSVKGGKLSGAGGDVLRAAVDDAQFVLMGEDHGIAQIPEFAGALWAELAPRGFHNVALEVGPSVAPKLEEFAKAGDGGKRLAEFVHRFPFSVAFYDWREEFTFLQQCEKSAGPAGMDISGLDQELMGASGYVVDTIQQHAASPAVRDAAQRLLDENKKMYDDAAKSGNPMELFLMKAGQDDFDGFLKVLKAQSGGDASANETLFEGLIASRDIYGKYQAEQGYASNRERARLMKTNFVEDYARAEKREGDAPKFFFKFGAFHMYRGLNPLHSSEIGNYVAELAEGRGQKSVHILIVGVKGKQLHFAGIGKPAAEAPLDLAGDPDSDFKFFAPLFENMVEGSWTLYDMRGLRDHFSKLGPVDPGLERVIFGYEFVVLIPEPVASHEIVTQP
jgi:hypothetical protein